MQIGMTDADGFEKHGDGFDQIVIMVSRESVEALTVGETVDKLMRLSDSHDRVRRFASSVWVLFAGYDDDPRPLAQIPEVVKFFREVNRYWSFWLHFLVKEPAQMGMLLSLLVDAESDPQGRGVTMDPAEISTCLLSLLGGMNALYEAHGVGLKDNKAMTDKVMAVVNRTLG